MNISSFHSFSLSPSHCISFLLTIPIPKAELCTEPLEVFRYMEGWGIGTRIAFFYRVRCFIFPFLLSPFFRPSFLLYSLFLEILLTFFTSTPFFWGCYQLPIHSSFLYLDLLSTVLFNFFPSFILSHRISHTAFYSHSLHCLIPLFLSRHGHWPWSGWDGIRRRKKLMKWDRIVNWR